jgi:hypothetical protein
MLAISHKYAKKMNFWGCIPQIWLMQYLTHLIITKNKIKYNNDSNQPVSPEICSIAKLAFNIIWTSFVIN